ncbi:hypothetical protein [Pseudomaricurvus sp. HS19]|uniref:hypothetical protein n=1 Tax=Pseudomaricurvus sp. HS19 TaxID=2692626 RepID=UPI0013716363|nr:hypothetical protein [Pseudomaricurvus sp. HS19]MYM62204.1 hypothetical protein [Pseudomaricurvus sp. HS19]
MQVLFLLDDRNGDSCDSALNGALTHALMGIETAILFLNPPTAEGLRDKLAMCRDMGVRLTAVHRPEHRNETPMAFEGIELLDSNAARELLQTARHCLSP